MWSARAFNITGCIKMWSARAFNITGCIKMWSASAFNITGCMKNFLQISTMLVSLNKLKSERNSSVILTAQKKTTFLKCHD